MDAKMLQTLVEGLVDGASVAEVIEALAATCDEKAQHILEGWQDLGLARAWISAARKIGPVAGKLPNVPGISPTPAKGA